MIMCKSDFEDVDFRPKIKKCKQLSEMVRFGTVASKVPPTLGWIFGHVSTFTIGRALGQRYSL